MDETTQQDAYEDKEDVAFNPILVVGAGPAGLAFALECRRRGIAVRVIDKRPQRHGISKATGVAAGVVELLSVFGLDAVIEAEATPMRTFVFNDDEARIATVSVPPVGRKPPAYLYPQLELEKHMEAALAAFGVSVAYGSELEALEAHGSAGIRVRVRDADGVCRTIDTPWLVGADGAHSIVRSLARFEFIGRDYLETWSVAEITTAYWNKAREAELFLGRDGVGLFLSSPRRHCVQAILNAPAVVQRLTGLYPDGVLNYEREFHVGVRRVPTPRQGRVWLIGDAAHVQSPVGGQGLNLAVWDGIMLARGFASGELSAAERKLRRRARMVLAFTDFDYRLLATTSPLLQKVRDGYWKFAARRAWASRWFFKIISGFW